MHALQLLPELSDDKINDIQQEDSVISLLRSWLDLEYEPSRFTSTTPGRKKTLEFAQFTDCGKPSFGPED